VNSGDIQLGITPNLKQRNDRAMLKNFGAGRNVPWRFARLPYGLFLAALLRIYIAVSPVSCPNNNLVAGAEYWIDCPTILGMRSARKKEVELLGLPGMDEPDDRLM
jgi:hypothetical protein